MVSMSPNSEKYNFTFKWNSLCDSKPKQPEGTTIYHVLKKNPKFTKITKLIEMGMLAEYLKKDHGGFTLFVTEDVNVPEAFMKTTDLFTSKSLINSYLLDGIGSKDYFIKNMSSVYKPLNKDNPMLIYIPENTQDIYINRVGKLLYSIPASNGVIHVMSNMAQVQYVN